MDKGFPAWIAKQAGNDLASGESKCLAFVQTYDQKPKRRLFELLRSQRMQMNQQITFLTDGGEDIRDLPEFMNPEAEHILDWFSYHQATHGHEPDRQRTVRDIPAEGRRGRSRSAG